MNLQINSFEKKVKITEDMEIEVLEIAGKINMSTVDQLNNGFNEAIKKGKKNYLLIMKHIETIKSAGLGAILSFAKRVDRMGGVVKLAELPPNITHVFDLLSMGEILRIYDSSSEAIQSFRGLFQENIEKIRRLNEKNEELTNELERGDRDFQSTSDPITLFKRFFDEIKKRIRVLRLKNKELQTKNEELKKRLMEENSKLHHVRVELERLGQGNISIK